MFSGNTWEFSFLLFFFYIYPGTEVFPLSRLKLLKHTLSLTPLHVFWPRTSWGRVSGVRGGPCSVMVLVPKANQH